MSLSTRINPEFPPNPRLRDKLFYRRVGLLVSKMPKKVDAPELQFKGSETGASMIFTSASIDQDFSYKTYFDVNVTRDYHSGEVTFVRANAVDTESNSGTFTGLKPYEMSTQRQFVPGKTDNNLSRFAIVGAFREALAYSQQIQKEG